jgi:hypothetical protein
MDAWAAQMAAREQPDDWEFAKFVAETTPATKKQAGRFKSAFF